MIEYEEIKSVAGRLLEKAGFILAMEEKDPHAFSSQYCEYARGERRYRVVWDGKEGCGFVQRRTAGSCSNLSVFVPMAGHKSFANALTRLYVNLEQTIALDA
jgi:hypothetical protein